jgi:ribonuclease-3
VQSESGPQHQKTFEVEVWLGGRKWSSSTGLTKKEAEQSAARLALESMEASGEVA